MRSSRPPRSPSPRASRTRPFIAPREKRRHAPIVAALLLTVASRTAAAAEIRVRPPQAAATIAAREAATFSFAVASPYEDAKVRVSFGDFELDADGRVVAASSSARSCARVARADRTEISPGPTHEETVRVRVDVPDGPPGTSWCLLTFEVVAGARRSADGSAVQVVPRVSVPLLVTISGGSPAKITAVFSGPPERQGDAVTAALTFRNEGSAAAEVTGAVSAEEVSGAGVVELHRLPVRAFLLLPGGSRRLPLELPVKSALPLRLRADFDTGEGRRLELESPPAK